MAFFDDMKDTLTSVGRDVTQKTKEISGVTKLKLDIKGKEESLNREYIALGKHYYEMNKDGEVCQEQMANISTLLNEIATMKEEIMKIQGVCKCPNCGASLVAGAAFCNQCGTKIENTTL